MALFDDYINSTKEKEDAAQKRAEEERLKAEEEEKAKALEEKKQHDLIIPYFIEALKEMPKMTKAMDFCTITYAKILKSNIFTTKLEKQKAVVFTKIDHVPFSAYDHISQLPSEIMYTYQNEFIYPYTHKSEHNGYQFYDWLYFGDSVPVSVAAEVMYKEFLNSIEMLKRNEYMRTDNKYSFASLYEQKAYKEAVVKYFEISFNNMTEDGINQSLYRQFIRP